MSAATSALRRGPALARRLARAARRPELFARLELTAAALAAVLGLTTYAVLTGRAATPGAYTPPVVTLLIVLTLICVMALMTLLARRVVLLLAGRREGGARLQLRLVGLFAGVAAVPTLLVVAFAALLFQYGVQFWFSDRARTVLDNADRVAQAYVAENKGRLVGDMLSMRGDMALNARDLGLGSPRYREQVDAQTAARGLDQAAVFEPTDEGFILYGAAGITPAQLVPAVLRVGLVRAERGEVGVVTTGSDGVEALARVDARRFLYASRRVDAKVLDRVATSRSAIDDYRALTERSRTLQWRFNLALVLVSLLLLAAAIWAALRLARRLATPIAQLVGAAERVGEGDLSARVPVRDAPDELAALARTFNRMTGQIDAQRRALVDAGEQIDRRRQLTEAVLAGVSAGVLALDGDGVVRVANASAARLLRLEGDAVDRLLTELAPELAAWLAGGEPHGQVTIVRGPETQTLAVRAARTGDGGHVLTFDDISQQLSDQRRAAWADVARRIAHEIKNPLTPIQLSAERLKRRYSRQITEDPETFADLTGTIVAQVGDLRRMVDEFSSFARMPRPEFAPAAVLDIARQAVLLHEVAHPGIRFTLDAPDALPTVVCDRRQLAQALTNLLKNAAESVAARQERDGGPGSVTLCVRAGPDALTLSVADDGLGLPAERRDQLTEPYVTTRARGTGLGLAIVKKIVEEHDGALELADRAGGGAAVTMRLPLAALAARLHPAREAAE